jgi:hypothetical protein
MADDAIRKRLNELAESMPPAGRQRLDSKAAKVRLYLAEIVAYKARYPNATDMDVWRWLKTAGIADVKIDTVRKVLRALTQNAKPGVKRASKPRAILPPRPNRKTQEADASQAASAEPNTPPEPEADSPPVTSSYRSDPNDHAGIRRRNARA